MSNHSVSEEPRLRHRSPAWSAEEAPWPDTGLAQARIGWPFLGGGLLLLLLVLLVYAPLPFQDFVFIDDPGFVFQNRHVVTGLTLENVAWAFDLDTPSHWHPLTWLSLMFDAELDLILGGQGTQVRPVIFKLGNLTLFGISVLLLYAFLTVATGRRWLALMVAALYAVHPLNVETVAWISERKAVLSMALAMAALLAYALHHRYLSSAAYLLSVLFFAAACLSNPLVLPLPALLVLIDFWPLERWSGSVRHPVESVAWRYRLETPPWPGRAVSTLLLEKAPFFAVALLAGAATLIAHDQRGLFEQAAATSADNPGTYGISAVAEFLLTYLYRLFWPLGLTIGHEGGTPSVAWLVFTSVGMPLLLLTLTIGVLIQVRSRPFLLVGWLWYLICLGPLLGFVYLQVVGPADRYAQLPMIGLLLALCWWIAEGLNHSLAIFKRHPRCGWAAAWALILVLAGVAHGQVRVWQNTQTLQTHRLAIHGEKPEALNSLAVYYEQSQRMDDAIAAYQRALIAAPSFSPARFNLARLMLADGQYAEALHQADLATRLATLDGRGGLTRSQGLRLGASICRAADDLAGAVQRLAEAWRQDPSDPTLAWEQADLLLDMGLLEEALDVMRQVTETHPTDAAAWQQYGLLAYQLDPGSATARTSLMHATRLNRQLPDAWYVLGLMAMHSGDWSRAVWYSDRAGTLRPDRPNYLLLHGQALAASARFNEAHAVTRRALAIDPHFGPAIELLARIERSFHQPAPLPEKALMPELERSPDEP